MKVYAPKYYKDFVCTADKCRHSCCIGWEIDVDSRTLRKYRELGEKGKGILASIAEGDAPHFMLSEGERCPHLLASGLCNIILTYGESYLCDICREHPRFYNYTCRGKEVGLGLACEEACRLILSSDAYAGFDELWTEDGACGEAGFDAPAHRARIYGILSDGTLDYRDRLEKIYGEYGVFPGELPDEAWKSVFAELEYLSAGDRALFLCYSSRGDGGTGAEKQLERALAYFIYRHCSEAQSAWAFRVSLGFCLVLERLLASMCDRFPAYGAEQLARILSEEIEYSEENTERIKEMLL